MSIKILFICSFCLFIMCSSSSDFYIETYTVKSGDFISSITETGELAALSSKLISAPNISWRFGRLKIAKLIDDGKQVEKGDLLVEFDNTEVQKGIQDAQAELEIAQAELRKAIANQTSKIEELETNFEKTKIQHRISQLNLEKASYESEIRQKEIELELERASITLEKAEQEIDNQKIVNNEEINKLKLKVQQAQTKLDEANDTFAKLTVTAPSPGIAIIEKNWMTGNKYQIDDQPYSGWPMIGLPDLSRMKATTKINEVDISKIDTTLEARIRMDAFPDTAFHGKVTEVATLARNKERDSKVKIFDVTILLDKNNKKLMPGLTVSCEIIIEEISDTLFVPLESIYIKNGEKIVYLKKGGDFVPQPVTLGPENDNFVIITSGLKENDQIALTDPTELNSNVSKSKPE